MSFGQCAAIGIEQDSKLIAGVVYHAYSGGNDIQMSVAADSKRWLSRDVLRALFAYPFVQVRCDRVTALTMKSNRSTRKFLLGIGFDEEGNIRRGFRTDDCIVYGMLREECKWIRGKN